MISDQRFIEHFLQLASELWPGSPAAAGADGDDDEGHADSDDGEVLEEDLEKQIAKELASIKRPRKEQMFGMLHPPHDNDPRNPIQMTANHVANCQTNTPCGTQSFDILRLRPHGGAPDLW